MYLATILLEPNRWKRDSAPGMQWSDGWIAELAASGFCGLELWEGHVPSEREVVKALNDGPCPIRVFSWYGVPGDGSEENLLRIVEHLDGRLDGIKFNLGSDSARLDAEARAVEVLAEKLGPEIHLICECHSGTSMEDPAVAARVFDGWPPSVVAALHPFNGPAGSWLDTLGRRIRHLHLQARENGAWLDPVPGIPSVDSGLALLAAHRFAGTASLEFVSGITGGLGPAELLGRAGAVREILGPSIAPFLHNP